MLSTGLAFFSRRPEADRGRICKYSHLVNKNDYIFIQIYKKSNNPLKKLIFTEFQYGKRWLYRKKYRLGNFLL